MEKLRHVAKLLSVNTVIFLFSLVILEALFGNWSNDDQIDRLNILRSSTINYDLDNLYASSAASITYTRDEHGLRGYFDHPSEIEILTVGGSTTDQRYIDDAETWQAVLQQAFEPDGKTVIVANAGVDGQSTFGHVKNFDWWFPHIPGLKPKAIIFYVGLNDFYKDTGYGYDALVKTTKSIGSTLSEKSAVYGLVRTIYGVYQAEIRQNIGHRSINLSQQTWVQDGLLESYDALMKFRLAEYSERLEFLITKTKELGSIPILVTQPSYRYREKDGVLLGTEEYMSYEGLQINGVDYRHMMRKLDQVTCDVASDMNALCIDLGKEFIWQQQDFYDYAHMTPSGARKVGEYLHEELSSLF